MDHKHSADLHYLWWLALVSIVGLLIYLLSHILTPLLLAGIIAYISNLLVTRMAIWKISRFLGALLTFSQLFGFVGLLLALPANPVSLVWLRHVRTQYLKISLYNS